jgi:hypothetical protein
MIIFAQISKFKLLRERKLIPQVVFQIEHFELAVIRFSKVTKTDIDKYLRRATARDFKFDVHEVCCVFGCVVIYHANQFILYLVPDRQEGQRARKEQGQI